MRQLVYLVTVFTYCDHLEWRPWVATLSGDLGWRPWVAKTYPMFPSGPLRDPSFFVYNCWQVLTYNAATCISSERCSHIAATLSGDLEWRPWVATLSGGHILYLTRRSLTGSQDCFYKWWPLLTYNATTCISSDRIHILWPPWVATMSGDLEWRPWVATLSGENIRYVPLRSLKGSQILFITGDRF